jgi:hypothetical protein
MSNTVANNVAERLVNDKEIIIDFTEIISSILRLFAKLLSIFMDKEMNIEDINGMLAAKFNTKKITSMLKKKNDSATEKEAKKKVIVAPFCGAVNATTCHAIVPGGGLLIPCSGKCKNSLFCNIHKDPAKQKYGTTDMRIKSFIENNGDPYAYVAPDGTKPVPYLNVVKNMTRDEIEAELGMKLLDIHFTTPATNTDKKKKTKTADKKAAKEPEPEEEAEEEAEPEPEPEPVVVAPVTIDTKKKASKATKPPTSPPVPAVVPTVVAKAEKVEKAKKSSTVELPKPKQSKKKSAADDTITYSHIKFNAVTIGDAKYYVPTEATETIDINVAYEYIPANPKANKRAEIVSMFYREEEDGEWIEFDEEEEDEEE